MQINKDFYSVGLQDPKLKVFDIVMITDYGSSYNSYLLKTTAGWVLFETVKIFQTEAGTESVKEYLKNIREVCDPDQIKYLVLNHTEPDHSGAVEWLIKLCHKDCVVLGTKIALEYVKKIHNHRFTCKVVQTDEIIKIGNKTLLFKAIPMMHWPDSMFTLIIEDKIAVTCDTLGTHYSFPEMLLSKMKKEDYKNSYLKSFKFYFDCIFSPFIQPVLNAMKIIRELIDRNEIAMVATGHGPILDSLPEIKRSINSYESWANDEKKKQNETKRIVLLLCSAYKFTVEAAKIIRRVIDENKNVKTDVKTFVIDVSNIQKQKAQIIQAINKCDGLLVGSPTIVNDTLPVIWEILASLSPLINAGKFAASFGSFGWSGEAVLNITQRLLQLKFQTLKGMRVRFRLSESEKINFIEFSNVFLNAIQRKNIPAEWRAVSQKSDSLVWES